MAPRRDKFAFLQQKHRMWRAGSESVNGAVPHLVSNAPKRRPRAKADVRAETERAVQEFLENGGRIRRE